jgi:magnesium-transporting ATPase (P-type)
MAAAPARSSCVAEKILDFNSDRKRMSVIVQKGGKDGELDGELRIYTKGADTMMEPRLAAGQDAMRTETFEQMRQFSLEGQ